MAVLHSGEASPCVLRVPNKLVPLSAAAQTCEPPASKNECESAPFIWPLVNSTVHSWTRRSIRHRTSHSHAGREQRNGLSLHPSLGRLRSHAAISSQYASKGYQLSSVPSYEVNLSSPCISSLLTFVPQILASAAHSAVSRDLTGNRSPGRGQDMGIPPLILFASYIPDGASYHCHHQTLVRCSSLAIKR